MPNDPRDHILFFPSGSLGDALMMLALCIEIHASRPNLTATIVARRNARMISDLASGHPYLRVIAVDYTLSGVWQFLRAAFGRPATVLMPAAFGAGRFFNTRSLFRLLSLRPGTQTFGLIRYEPDGRVYTDAISYDEKILHYDNMRRLARLAGYTMREEGSPVAYTLATASNPCPYEQGSYLVYHPFGSSSWKSFPPRRSHELLLKIRTQYPDLGLVITGGKENQEEAERIGKGVNKVFVATGLPILEAAAVIRDAKAYVGVDTGTLHLASLLNQHVVALEHNASPEWLPTYNPNAHILTTTEHCECGGHKNDRCVAWEEGKPYLRCLYEISDEAILELVKRLV